MRTLLIATLLLLTACKGGNNYASMAKEANAARADAGSAEAGPAPANATLLGAGNNSPRMLQLDGDSLYWLNEGGRQTGVPGLFMVPRGGGPTVALMKEGELMAMAADANAVYFLAPRAGKIGKVSRAGGTPEILAETTNVVRGLVIDETDVFWAENEGIMRVPKAGGKAQTVVAAGLPDMMTLDGTHVYWYSMIAGIIQKAPKKGGAASKVHADDQHTFHTFFLDGPDLFLSYGAANKMVIEKLPKTGGKPVMLIEGQDPGIDFAIDGSNVYWITEDNIFKVARGGGTASKAVEKLEHGRDVVVDDRFVYWADRSGRIQKMAK